MRPRVFILEPTKQDVDDALTFGDVVYVFGRGDERPSMWHDEYRTRLLRQLETLRYDPKIDYVAVVGPMAIVAIAIAFLVSEFGDVNVLLYNAVDKHYVPKRAGAHYDAA